MHSKGIMIKMSTEIFKIFAQAITTLMMNVFIFRFFIKVYHLKLSNKHFCIIIFVLSSILNLSFIRGVFYFNLPQVLNSVYLFAHINILSYIMCKGKIKRKFMYNVIFILILFFADVLSVAVCSVIKSISLQNVLTNDKYIIFSYALNLLIMFLLCNIYIFILSRNSIVKIKTTQIILLFLLTAFEIAVVYSYALKVSSNFDAVMAIILLIGFLVINYMITYVIEKIARSYEDKIELCLIRKQNELQLANYTEICKKYDQSRRTIHDIKKHLAMLKELSNLNSKESEEYSTLIERQVDSLFSGFQCSNQILSIVMSQKLSVAENENIDVKLNIEDVDLDFFDNLDITAIFANLWDNAIDACCKIDKENRYINVVLVRKNDMLVIYFENSFNGIVNEENNKLRTTKNNSNSGWGLSILNSVAEKYNGVFFFEYNKSIFKSELTIPIGTN